MGDLIWREDAIIELVFNEETKDIKCEDMRKVLNVLKKMPSAEPRKKGKWLIYGDIPTTCSCCQEDWDKYVNGDIWYTDELPKYCPNCGSYNGGEEDDSISD